MLDKTTKYLHLDVDEVANNLRSYLEAIRMRMNKQIKLGVEEYLDMKFNKGNGDWEPDLDEE